MMSIQRGKPGAASLNRNTIAVSTHSSHSSMQTQMARVATAANAIGPLGMRILVPKPYGGREHEQIRQQKESAC